jgi:hypothetical protein
MVSILRSLKLELVTTDLLVPNQIPRLFEIYWILWFPID